MQESLLMWPLTCYGFKQHIRGLPDLVDVSPEELRLEAYKAESSGSPNDYLKNVDRLVKQQIDLRTRYGSSITEVDIKQMVSMALSTSKSTLDTTLVIFFSLGQHSSWYVWWDWLI